jgi:hypothetical protein
MSDKEGPFRGPPTGSPDRARHHRRRTAVGISRQHGGELPTEIDGHKVPASFRDSLLEQKDNWTEVKRSDKTTAAKAEEGGLGHGQHRTRLTARPQEGNDVGHGRHGRQVLQVRVGDVRARPHYVDPIGLQSGITFAPQSLTAATTRTAGGAFSAYVPYKLTGHLLDQMVAGTITPVQQAASIAYLSTFNVGSSLPTKSATIQINKPSLNAGDTAYTYPGRCSESPEFSMETGGLLMGNWGWLSKDETTPATTPAGAALASASYATGDNVWTHVGHDAHCTRAARSTVSRA